MRRRGAEPGAVRQRGFARRFVPTLLVILLLFVLGWEHMVQSELEPLENRLERQLASAVAVINRRAGSTPRDLELLARHPVLLDAIDSQAPIPLRRLEDLFVTFAEASRDYDQLRWIDEHGRERVRVDWRDNHAVRIPADQLQDKADRYYVRDALKLPPGVLYASRLDLNIEHGEIERPLKPMLRFASPVTASDGTPRGLVVLNYRAGRMLSGLEILDASLNVLQLLEHEGYRLAGGDPQRQWGFMLGQPQATLAQTAPLSWARIQSGDNGHFADINGLWHFTTIRLIDDNGLDLGSNGLKPWKLIAHVDAAAINAIRARQAWALGSIALMMTLAAAWVSSHLARLSREREAMLHALEQRTQALSAANLAQQQAYERLQRTQAELVRAEKLSSLGLMVAGVAHELNTPIGSSMVVLSTLQQHAERLREQLLSGLRRSDLDNYLKRHADGMTLVTANLERAAALVRSFKQLAVDRSSAERRRFRLDELLTDILRALQPRLKHERSRLLNQIPAGIELDSFPGPLGQVLQNLIDNAFTHAFSEHAGTLELRAGPADEVGWLRIEVIDDGIGIPPQNIEQVFDPFFTTRRGQGGCGLGLHLAHQLASEVLGGHLSVHSETGAGSCFTLEIPLSAPPFVARPAPQLDD